MTFRLPSAAAIAGASPRVQRVYGRTLVLVATVMWSSGGVFARAIPVDSVTMQGWRALFGSISLIAFIAWGAGRQTPQAFVRAGPITLLAVPAAAISMAAYVGALKLTTVANVMIVYATLPFVAAGIAYLWMGERLGRRAAIAGLAALAGVVVMVGGSARMADVAGNLASLAMTATFAALVVMARRHPRLDMAPINAMGALLCALVCLPLSAALPEWPDLALLALFGVVTTSLAYMLFLVGSRYIPAAESGVIALLDVVIGPLWVYLLFGENPGMPAVVGGAIVLAALLWYLVGGDRRRPAPTP